LTKYNTGQISKSEALKQLAAYRQSLRKSLKVDPVQLARKKKDLEAMKTTKPKKPDSGNSGKGGGGSGSAGGGSTKGVGGGCLMSLFGGSC
jgi:hypothetical protein